MTDVSTGLVDLADVRAAAALLAGVARRTPVERAGWLTGPVGGDVLLKCENLQHTGSFKVRGAYTRIARLDPEVRARGVVAASAGNHAQGVAYAGRLLGAPVTVFMPAGAALPKLAATEGYGAEVRIAGTSVDEALVAARVYAAERGAELIHPFDHPDVIAGQGTVGLELLEQCPDVRTVLVAAGGGGLLAGIAVAVRALRPDVRVVAAQAAGAAAWPPSLAAGAPTPLGGMRTMADGIAVGRPGDVTFRHVSALVHDMVTVTEADLSAALLACLERAKLLVEPAGAAGLAALAATPGAFTPPVAVVLSGGNVDPLVLLKVIRHGLTAAGRYLSLRVRMPDLPGSLAALLDVLAATKANVQSVDHVRARPELDVEEVEVAVQMETRGPGHAAEVTAALAAAGYPVGL